MLIVLRFFNMKSIIISGSCVSRDMLNYVNPDKYHLIKNFSRSSLAILNSDPVQLSVYHNDIDKLESAFQKRMLKADFQRLLLQDIDVDLREKNQAEMPDIFLIDLIDERFHLAILECGGIVTRSNEFMKTAIKCASLIDTYSDKYFEIWCKGIDKLFNLIDPSMKEKIVVQKAYWVKELDNGQYIQDIASEIFDKQNAKLDRMYDYLSRFLQPSQFVTFPKSLLKINSSHQWGAAPFHYIDEYYLYLADCLQLEVQ